jgi:hypothetical protein
MGRNQTFFCLIALLLAFVYGVISLGLGAAQAQNPPREPKVPLEQPRSHSAILLGSKPKWPEIIHSAGMVVYEMGGKEYKAYPVGDVNVNEDGSVSFADQYQWYRFRCNYVVTGRLSTPKPKAEKEE